MKTLLLALAAAGIAGSAFAQQSGHDARVPAEVVASVRTATANASPEFDWLLAGVGITMVIGAISVRPRRLTKVSS